MSWGEIVQGDVRGNVRRNASKGECPDPRAPAPSHTHWLRLSADDAITYLFIYLFK